MRFGAVTLVSSVAGGLTVLLLAVVLVAMRHISSDMQAIRRRIDAEQRRREEIRRKVETPEEPETRPHLRLVHKLPPTLFVLSALSWELVKRHPVPSLGLTSAAAGLAASAVLLTPAVRPPMTNPGPATGPTPVVHVPAPGRTTPVRKEAAPVGTHSPEVPTGPPMSPAADTVSPAPSPAAIIPPQTVAPASSPVLPLPSVLLTSAVTTPRLPLPLPTRRICVTIGRINICT